MKKTLLMLLAIFILIYSTSCDSQEQDTDTVDCEVPDYIYDLDEFLQGEAQEYKESSQQGITTNSNSDAMTLPIPKSIKEGCEFLCLTEGPYFYNFYFVSEDYDDTVGGTERMKYQQFYVTVAKNLNTFEANVTNRGLAGYVVDNYYAYSDKHDDENSKYSYTELLINMNNRYVNVRSYHDSIETPEQLSNYIIFENFDLSGSNSNHEIK